MSRWWWCGLLAGCVGSFGDIGDVPDTAIGPTDGGVEGVRCETRVWEVGPTRPVDGTGAVWTVAEPGTPLVVELGIDETPAEELVDVATRTDADGREVVLWAREVGPLPPGDHDVRVRWIDDGMIVQPCFPDVQADVEVRAMDTAPATLPDGVWSFEGFGQHPDANLLSRVFDATRAGGRGFAVHVSADTRTLAAHARAPGFPEDGCVASVPLTPGDDGVSTASTWSVPDDGGGAVTLHAVTVALSPRTDDQATLALSATLDLREATDRAALCGPDGPVQRAGLVCGACPGDPDAQGCAAVSVTAVDAALRPPSDPAVCPP